MKESINSDLKFSLSSSNMTLNSSDLVNSIVAFHELESVEICCHLHSYCRLIFAISYLLPALGTCCTHVGCRSKHTFLLQSPSESENENERRLDK